MSFPHGCIVAASSILVGASAFSQQTERVSVDSSGAESDGGATGARISADGRFVVFESAADNLVPNDTNGVVDIFVHDRVTGTTERVSVDSNGVEANGGSFGGSISADGQYVAFASMATNWANLGLAWENIFVRDRVSGMTELISVNQYGNAANSASFTGAISANGRYVVFQSLASDLVAGDANGNPDAFIRDRQLDVTELVSVDSAGVQGNKISELPAVSADGMVVAFTSFATNLVAGDTNNSEDVFVHDRSTGTTERVSVDSNGVEGDHYSTYPSISADGRFVAFESYSFNLVANDNNNDRDVFLHDRATGATECVSHDSTGATANGGSRAIAGISADGRFVAFSSAATNLVAGDTNNRFDAFVRDRATDAIELISVDSAGVQGDANSAGVDISANGETVVFFSDATNLVANDTNGLSDAFVRERCVALRYDYGAGYPGTLGIPGLAAQSDPILGSAVALVVGNSLGASTTGVLVLGLARIDVMTKWGGRLLADPTLRFGIPIPANGATISGVLPSDPALCGLTVELQALQLDPGATKGVSFTRGLELILGH